MNRSEGAKKVGPPQKNSLDPLLNAAKVGFGVTTRKNFNSTRRIIIGDLGVTFFVD